MEKYDVVIVGAGFTGLATAFSLAKQGIKVHVLESGQKPGGLAGAFEFSDGVRVEKFYHHWFNNDFYMLDLIKELDMTDDILRLPSHTGIYYKGQIWDLSTPLDLLRFKPLSLFDRIRLGMLVLKVRSIKDWKSIEHLSIKEWLEPICGKSAYRVVWEPLVKAKFSVFANEVSASWMWKKLVLRGGTRNKRGEEELLYFKGGFGKLNQAFVKTIQESGGELSFGTSATGVVANGRTILALKTDKGEIRGQNFVFTPALPITADIFEGTADNEWITKIRRVRYLGNMCLVLRLNSRLSDIYWLNVNDHGFPFVGLIEHTNFDKPENYRGTHIVYLSKYLSVEDPIWSYSNEAYFNFALEYLKKMFPKMNSDWILEYKVWRSKYAHPVTERNYSKYVPPRKTPFDNAWISTMAQIYPEDRGTNYAVREGKSMGQYLIDSIL